jgi:plastocyanin
MIVYLESTDPKYTFELPEEPLVVSQRDAKFEPDLLVVPVGTRVVFHNNETKLEHNVFSNSAAKKFDLGLYKPGEKVEPVHFDTPGAVRLRCSIHRFMDGVVYVTPTPHHAVVDKDGKFAMKGVPQGAYRLKTWQRTKRYRDQDLAVTVEAGKPVADVAVTLSK